MEANKKKLAQGLLTGTVRFGGYAIFSMPIIVVFIAYGWLPSLVMSILYGAYFMALRFTRRQEENTVSMQQTDYGTIPVDSGANGRIGGAIYQTAVANNTQRQGDVERTVAVEIPEAVKFEDFIAARPLPQVAPSVQYGISELPQGGDDNAKQNDVVDFENVQVDADKGRNPLFRIDYFAKAIVNIVTLKK